MKLKQLLSVLTILFFSYQIFAQSNIEDFVKEGIEYHDNGNYDKAIETYKKALEIDSKNALVNYELALSHHAKQDYKSAIKYSDVVLKQNGNFMIQANLTKASALDRLGKTKESIKLLEKAIKKTDGHFLLNYNLALNYFNANQLDKSEKNTIQAIEQNSNHTSSHFLLAHIHYQKGNTVQTLLAIHYFLLLEPNSERSVVANRLLQEVFGGNVSQDNNKPNTINITLSGNQGDKFGAAELMVSMLEASKTLEENEGKSEDEMFVKNTNSFFSVLGELKDEESTEIWWTFYTTFFYDLANSDHLETYCKYITQSVNEDSQNWLSANQDKLVSFVNWMKGQ